MNHKQALSDYETLRAIAIGEPHDAGEILEQIGNKMLSRPTAKEATKHLCQLIEFYFDLGGPQGESLREIPEAHEIFVRHMLVNDDEEDGD
ncbi:hypothetical protein [Pseudomonas sp. UMAB-40]|uniref:hypothetical protein n=1 Tax=Pseudomonas sp. UMAB-40 TaxID=1365407 RepID=UPI001C594ACA|nr:hypothetical protein [Pseudomonas sp. UMAB-40]